MLERFFGGNKKEETKKPVAEERKPIVLDFQEDPDMEMIVHKYINICRERHGYMHDGEIDKVKEADKKAKKAKAGEEADQMDLESLGIPEVKRVSKKTLSEGIIRPRLNEIFTMVRIELEKAVLSSSIPSGAIITGGGAETVEVIDSARRMLSLPVRIGLPRGIGELTDDVINPAFSTCTGLILWGARQEPQAGLSGIGKRFKLPTKGIAGRLIQAVKNLLP